MLSKEAKIRILESFYALDEVFFGKNVKELDICCPFFVENYLQIKGAFLSIVSEMYDKLKVTPPVITEMVTTEKIVKRASKVADIVRESAARILKTKRGRNEVKQEVLELLKEDSDVNTSKLIENKIKEKSFTLAVDNLILARALVEAKEFDFLENTYEGKILENSYKVLRDSLVESALDVLNLLEDDEENDE